MSRYDNALPWSPSETMVSYLAQWGFDTPLSEQRAVNCCNDILEEQIQRTPVFHASMENESSRGSFSAASGSQSPPGRSSPRPSRRSANNKDAKPSQKDRRREQNRTAQRAFRDRKEKQLKTLETEIAHWEAKHKGLCESYFSQSAEVRELTARIEELTSRIVALQTELSARLPMEFDLLPAFDWNLM